MENPNKIKFCHCSESNANEYAIVVLFGFLFHKEEYICRVTWIKDKKNIQCDFAEKFVWGFGKRTNPTLCTQPIRTISSGKTKETDTVKNSCVSLTNKNNSIVLSKKKKNNSIVFSSVLV